MLSLIDSVIYTLEKSKVLLNSIDNNVFCDNSIEPYCSSIGSHIRHIFDFYFSIFNINDNVIDLTLRRRNTELEVNKDIALEELDNIINGLKLLIDKLDNEVIVKDNFGFGVRDIKYNYSSLLAQSNSHTIHHYAIINYILYQLDIVLEDSDFGFNPTTPIVKK